MAWYACSDCDHLTASSLGGVCISCRRVREKSATIDTLRAQLEASRELYRIDIEFERVLIRGHRVEIRELRAQLEAAKIVTDAVQGERDRAVMLLQRAQEMKTHDCPYPFVPESGCRWCDAVSDFLAGITPPAPPDKAAVCSTCNDTHRMHMEDRDRDVPCTRCPLPCQSCRQGGLGAYCGETPCRCACHRVFDKDDKEST